VPVLVPGFEEKRGFFYQKITFFQITGGLFYINLPFLTLDQKSEGSSPSGATLKIPPGGIFCLAVLRSYCLAVKTLRHNFPFN
jgi:hypothetical protein